MPVVFVHGVPETALVWQPIQRRLGQESIALSLPGFGCPRPGGFGGTMDEYAGWLGTQLAAIDGPVDLVGHDWGGILTARVATSGMVPLRTWVTDAVVAVHPIFRWHDLAKIWQTPGDGEEFWARFRASPVESAALLGSLGVPDGDTMAMVEAIDETMCTAILDLYRSAHGIGARWKAVGEAPAPGLVLIGSADHFGNEPASRRVADHLGMDVQVLAGAGHWWPLEAADDATAHLERFWSSAGRRA